MKNKKEIQRYFKDKYYNKNKNYKIILSKISKEDNISMNNFLRIVATIIITLLGTTGIAFASTKIYNQYIKNQEEICSRSLFDVGNGITTYETDLMENDMIWDSNCQLYYKLISNIKDYNKYKTRINEIPEMLEKDFNKSFLIIIANDNLRKEDENNLTISNITANETTINITMKQKENFNDKNQNNIYYAVVDKSLLRKNISIKIENDYIDNLEFTKLEYLTNIYNLERALKDGCFVEQNGKVLSNDKYAVDEFIDKANKEGKAFIRIYSESNNNTNVIDIEYKDGEYISNILSLNEKKIYTNKYKYIIKGNKKGDNSVKYFFTNDNNYSSENGNWKGQLFIDIYQE